MSESLKRAIKIDGRHSSEKKLLIAKEEQIAALTAKLQEKEAELELDALRTNDGGIAERMRKVLG